MATTTPSTADRGTPDGYVAGPRTLAERLRRLREDAVRILQQPNLYHADEVRWAHDMLHTGIAEART